MLQPIKTAFGAYLGRYYAGLVATTPVLRAYVARGLSTSILRAPARMVDSAEEMLATWQRSDPQNAPTRPADLPVILFALAKDYVPTGRDYTRQVADPILVTLPNDPHARMFGLRTVAGDLRAQLCLFAHDEPTAHALAAQFLLFLDASANRRFSASYTWAGLPLDWPVQIESPELPAMTIATDAKNLTILAIDLTLKIAVPLFDAPGVGEPNDGKGVPGTDDPAGYPGVVEVDADSRVPELLRRFIVTDERDR
jgi:hypothetical protein